MVSISSPPPILLMSSKRAVSSPSSSRGMASIPHSISDIRLRTRVALYRMPDSWFCLTTVVRFTNSTPPIIDIYSHDRAGDISRPTGGSCAESPMSTTLQPVPFLTNLTKSSRRLPEPKAAVLCCEEESIPMRDTSSTTNSVSLSLFRASENSPNPSPPTAR